MKLIKSSILGLFCAGYIAAADFSFVVIGDTRPPFGSSSCGNFRRQIDRINPFSPAFVTHGDVLNEELAGVVRKVEIDPVRATGMQAGVSVFGANILGRNSYSGGKLE